MKYGFSFNGIHSDTISSLTVKTVSRPVTPSMRDNKIIVPHADGAIGASYRNPYGRAFYDMRIFTVCMQMAAPNLIKLHEKLAQISEWLTGEGKLIFDDIPLICWDVISVGSIDFAPERYGTKAVISASFEVEPFGRLIWTAAEGPEIGAEEITIGSFIPIGSESGYNGVMTGSSLTMNVLNYGGRYVRPVIKFKASPSNTIGTVSVTANGNAGMTVYSASAEAIADCKNQTLTDADGNNIMAGGLIYPGFLGQFIELKPGVNELVFTKGKPASGGEIEISVDFEPAVMWNIDLNNEKRE